MRITGVLIGAGLVMVGCSGEPTASSPAGDCLKRHDYVLVKDGPVSTWKGPEGQYINLARFKGTVQPVDQGDLRDYVAAGCN